MERRTKGRDAKGLALQRELEAKAWSNPDAVGCDIRYCCHDPIFIRNRKGEIILLYAKFLDTEVNFTTWCNGRDELWMRKTTDGGRTRLPARPANIQSGHASNDSVPCRTAPSSSLHLQRDQGPLLRRGARLPVP